MADASTPRQLAELVRTVRQARQYAPDPLPPDVVDQLLQVARWTGSSRNTQPWRFIVVADREQLRRLSRLRPPIGWVADAPLGIAIILDGANSLAEAYDEGRVVERLLIAARALGYGGGVAWYGDDTLQGEAKRILAVPSERTARSIVLIGRPTSIVDPRPTRAAPGRKPLADLVSYDRWDGPRP